MLNTLFTYIPLWTSCLLASLGLTLMLVAAFSEALTAKSRAVLVGVSYFAGLLFLICYGQWIYAVCAIGFIYGGGYRRWVNDPTDRRLRISAWSLLWCGTLGLVDYFHWFSIVLGPLRHPVISAGVFVAALAVVVWGALRGRRANGASA